MITSEDVYQLPIEQEIKNEDVLLVLIKDRFNYLQELGNWTVVNTNSLLNFREQDRVVLKIIKSERRKTTQKIGMVDAWRLASVYYMDNPIMIITNIEDRFPHRFITDIDNFKLMIRYLYSFIKKEDTNAYYKVDEEFIYGFAGAGVLEDVQVLQDSEYLIDHIKFNDAVYRALSMGNIWKPQ